VEATLSGQSVFRKYQRFTAKAILVFVSGPSHCDQITKAVWRIVYAFSMFKVLLL